ncbi:Hypothetical predicted protein [Mytilus galloprovincialis]|uniref:Reverse transcriptase domain-containing protein n=1 Tax=Mytilus galloprovincialis TaxID=29158 RepID=A0A8B6ENQ2_MYTGA|nr:Hypothetical predicted protein [Mytilus galloprovincialis]
MKEGWSCKSCQKVFKGEDDKIVQCEYCTFYYCNQCLKLSDDDYEHFKSPALHWFCAACETKVMKNLRTDHEVEARCAKFLEAMEGRVSKLEEQIKNKVDESKVKDLIQELASSTDTNEAAAKVVESVNQKVSDLRDSALREKNIIIFDIHKTENNTLTVASSDSDKAEVLADFFSSVFTNENDNNMPAMEKVDYSHQSSDDLFNKEEVRKLLLNLNITKSPGPDRVHPKLLFELASVVDKPLCMIFNSSFVNGEVPEDWKIAIITALFKKGDKKSASNYRPVSLTSILCKIMEKLIRKRIIEHMDRQNLFSNQQFGFMGGRSTSLQLLKVLDKWTKVLDKGGILHSVYMDFMKAFDKVPHMRLLHKIKHYAEYEILSGSEKRTIKYNDEVEQNILVQQCQRSEDP